VIVHDPPTVAVMPVDVKVMLIAPSAVSAVIASPVCPGANVAIALLQYPGVRQCSVYA
jgi:hypothetical protein